MQLFDFFEKLKNEDVYIFGAGSRGIAILSMLEKYSIPVEAFIDNNPYKQGKMVCNKKCISIENAINLSENNCSIIISPLDSKDIFEQLSEFNIKKIYEGTKIIREYYFSPITKEEEDYISAYPFNHYESPYPDICEIHDKEMEIFDYNKKIMDVNFNVEQQLEYIKKMNDIDIIDWSEKQQLKYRYYYDNSWFGKGSADVLYYMMRILKPSKIIEVGSGFSTAVMLDTNNLHFQNSIEISAIEPNPERLKSLLRENDNLKIFECNLQDIPLEFFEQLKENDILFIDSSHVSTINSDVNYYLFEIFPRLAKGVYIHIHDVFYPFIYPKEWIYEGRAYNEMYLLRAFLMNNSRYSIQFFGEMLMHDFADELCDKLKNIAGSLWIRKDF